MPPEHLVCVIHSLMEGLVMQRILTPELCPDDVFYAAFDALSNKRQSRDASAWPRKARQASDADESG